MQSLIEKLPTRLERLVASSVPSGEARLIQMKGAFKECLICTPKRLMIAKTGMMTGHLFGGAVFQLPMSAVTSVEVKFNLLSGYLEVATGGMQNTDKSYWSQDPSRSPAKAPNCISIASRGDAEKFRRACSEILSIAEDARHGYATA